MTNDTKTEHPETKQNAPVATQDDIAEVLKKLSEYLDGSGISEYVKLARRPFKLFWLNFFSGVARGLGFTVGTALVLALLYKILSELISMNIPYITEVLRDLFEMVQTPPSG